MTLQQNTDRIQTTHIGSLPRPHAVLDMMKAKFAGQPYDQKVYDATITKAVADSVRKQVDCGIDIVTDGEVSKPGFFTYIQERLEGFESRPKQKMLLFQQEVAAFPEYYAQYFKDAMMGGAIVPLSPVVCIGPVKYRGEKYLQIDIDNVKAAAKAAGVPDHHVFLPATAPSGVGINEYYKSEEDYFHALAAELNKEYKAIVGAGILVQVDDPFLPDIFFEPGLDDAQKKRRAEIYVEATNVALKGIPAEMVRFHTCYGINEGPRLYEASLADVIGYMLKINAGSYSFECANPRHEHEYHLFERIKLPEGKVVCPGMITHASNIVEHPELIAERIMRFAKLVGRENVIAAAIGGGDHVLAAHQLGEAHDALRDQLRMLHDVAGVGDHAGADHLALRQLDALEQVVFVLVTRIGALEAVGAGVDLEHVADHVGQAGFVQARAFVDAVAGVEAHHLGRNAFERDVGGLDIDFRPPLLLGVVEAGLEEDVGQEGVVHLDQDAGRDDRLVFLVQLGRERVEIVFLGLVILVDADARRRRRRQEHVMIRDARGLGRGFDIIDVDLEILLAAVLDRTDADHRRQRHDRAAHHRILEVLRVVFRECRDLLLEQQHLLFGPGLEAFESLLDVGEEARLRDLAVGHDVDAALDLLAHAVRDRLGDGRVVYLLVIGLAGELRLHHIEHGVRPRQAADMRRLDAIDILLNGHGHLSRFVRAIGARHLPVF